MSEFKRACNFQVVEDRRMTIFEKRDDRVDCLLTTLSNHHCDFENCIIYKTYMQVMELTRNKT